VQTFTFHGQGEFVSVFGQCAVPLVGHDAPRPSQADQHGCLQGLLQRQVILAGKGLGENQHSMQDHAVCPRHQIMTATVIERL